MITEEDVNLIALSHKINGLSEEQIKQIVNEYPSNKEQEPSIYWDLFVEAQIYEKLIQNAKL